MASGSAWAGPIPSICDAISGNLILNCGFEALPISVDAAVPLDWTGSDFTGYEDVVTSHVNSGAYAMQIGNYDYQGAAILSQSFSGIAGATYQVTFYLYNNAGANTSGQQCARRSDRRNCARSRRHTELRGSRSLLYATSTSSRPCTFVRAISVACAQLPGTPPSRVPACCSRLDRSCCRSAGPTPRRTDCRRRTGSGRRFWATQMLYGAESNDVLNRLLSRNVRRDVCASCGRWIVPS
jgi:hypothetical protein